MHPVKYLRNPFIAKRQKAAHKSMLYAAISNIAVEIGIGWPGLAPGFF